MTNRDNQVKDGLDLVDSLTLSKAFKARRI